MDISAGNLSHINLLNNDTSVVPQLANYNCNVDNNFGDRANSSHGILSWIHKDVEHWTSEDVMLFFKSTVSPQLSNSLYMSKATLLNGQALLNMNLNDFKELDSVLGDILYYKLRSFYDRAQRDSYFHMCKGMEEPEEMPNSSEESKDIFTDLVPILRADLSEGWTVDNFPIYTTSGSWYDEIADREIVTLKEEASMDSGIYIFDYEQMESSSILGTPESGDWESFLSSPGVVPENISLKAQFPLKHDIGSTSISPVYSENVVSSFIASSNIHNLTIDTNVSYSEFSDPSSSYDFVECCAPNNVHNSHESPNLDSKQSFLSVGTNSEDDRRALPSCCFLPRKGRYKLWQFLLDLLDDGKFSEVIRWEDKKQSIFSILNSEEVAHLWGTLRCNRRMTYEKLSRAIRFARVAGYFAHIPVNSNFPRKLCFKFGPKAIKKI